MVAKEALWRQIRVWSQLRSFLVPWHWESHITFILVLVSFHMAGNFRNSTFLILASYSRRWWFTVSSCTTDSLSLHRGNFLKGPLSLHDIHTKLYSSTFYFKWCPVSSTWQQVILSSDIHLPTQLASLCCKMDNLTISRIDYSIICRILVDFINIGHHLLHTPVAPSLFPSAIML